jgi:chemotaxis protein methyltransferase CheR
MNELGIDKHQAYIDHVKADKTGTEVIKLLDAISTNVTHFFREPDHFDTLRDIVDGWFGEGQDRIRVWCSASSTGQEPYTISMSLSEIPQARTKNVRILATDISTRALGRAKEGNYSTEEIEKIPLGLLNKYFVKEKSGNVVRHQVKADQKKMVLFGRLNLSEFPFPMKGPLDVIFCRNVMIYFNNELRVKIIGEFERLLKVGGYLMVGHSESLAGYVGNFQMLRPSVFVKTA